MRIFGKIKINGKTGEVLVADCFFDDEELKAQTMIEFDNDDLPIDMMNFTNNKSEIVVNIEDNNGEIEQDIKLSAYTDCDYIIENVARIFMVIADIKGK